MNQRAAIYALGAAVLFGASTPIAKVLLDSVHPAVLAGLFYLGAGIGCGLLRMIRAGGSAVATPLGAGDFPYLFGAIVAGGTAAPLLLFYGLSKTEASAASLLLTLEGAATALLAWVFFRENAGTRVLVGVMCLTLGAAALAYSGTPRFDDLVGPLAIVAACVAWGLDNNLTRKIALSDALEITQWKGLVAGPTNLALGFLAGASMPGIVPTLSAALVGFVCYGLSLSLFVVALRGLGAARTSAYFSTAPFIGAAMAIIVLGEPITLTFTAAVLLMAAGVWLHLSEHHSHWHTHEPIEHEHPHVHDAHHQHEHGPGDRGAEPHTHRHRHTRLHHDHGHTPDSHHTHRH